VQREPERDPLPERFADIENLYPYVDSVLAYLDQGNPAVEILRDKICSIYGIELISPREEPPLYSNLLALGPTSGGHFKK
jgi:hypothetical protein